MFIPLSISPALRRICFSLAGVVACAFTVAEEPPEAVQVLVTPGIVFDVAALSPLSFSLDLGLSYASRAFDVFGHVSAHNDGKYGAELVDLPGGKSGSVYGMIDQGGIRFKYEHIAVAVGRLIQQDEIDSPYSLFVNSTSRSTMSASLSFDNSIFFYKSRWLGLNHDSGISVDAWPNGYPERGATYKVYGLRFGELSIGYQDVSVYTHRWFDAEYFVSPLPSYITQYGRSTDGKPWRDTHDDNTILGVFVVWDRPGEFDVHAQFLLDDFGLGFIAPSLNDNPWQMAFETGCRLTTDVGRFGLFAAMATRYTFAPSYGNNFFGYYNPYGYTYYPDTTYEVAGNARAFSSEDNLIGYKYGENNLALRLDWRGGLASFEVDSFVELRLSGSNSPANPWGDLISQPNGTHFLDDPVIEKRVIAELAVKRRFGDWELALGLLGGVAFDALQLRNPLPSASTSNPMDAVIPLWAPVSGLVLPLGRASFSVSWRPGP
jgi:hypothetical protein